MSEDDVQPFITGVHGLKDSLCTGKGLPSPLVLYRFVQIKRCYVLSNVDQSGHF